jgi:hypothetical protein
VDYKIIRLGLKRGGDRAATDSSSPPLSSKLELPKELTSVEYALKILAGALKMSTRAGLDKDEVQRLQVVATLARTYKEILVNYIDYLGIEVDLVELRRNELRSLRKKRKSLPRDKLWLENARAKGRLVTLQGTMF